MNELDKGNEKWRDEFELNFDLPFERYEDTGNEYKKPETHRMWVAYREACKKRSEEIEELNVVSNGNIDLATGYLHTLIDLRAENERLKKEVRIEGKAKSKAQSLITWHQDQQSKLESDNESLRELVRSARSICKTCIPNKTWTINYAQEFITEAEKALEIS